MYNTEDIHSEIRLNAHNRIISEWNIIQILWWILSLTLEESHTRKITTTTKKKA